MAASHPGAGLVGQQQRAAERGLRQQQLGGGAALGVLLHLLLQVADEHGGLLRGLPARVLDGEVHERQLRLSVLRLLVDGRLRAALRHPLQGRGGVRTPARSTTTLRSLFYQQHVLFSLLRTQIQAVRFGVWTED